MNEPEKCIVAEKLPEFCEKLKKGLCNGYESFCSLREYYEVESMYNKITKPALIETLVA